MLDKVKCGNCKFWMSETLACLCENENIPRSDYGIDGMCFLTSENFGCIFAEAKDA